MKFLNPGYVMPTELLPLVDSADEAPTVTSQMGHPIPERITFDPDAGTSQSG